VQEKTQFIRLSHAATHGAADTGCGVVISPGMIEAAAIHLSEEWGICGFDEAQEIVEVVFRTMISESDQFRDEKTDSG